MATAGHLWGPHPALMGSLPMLPKTSDFLKQHAWACR